MRERVDDRVVDGGRGADRRRLTDALGSVTATLNQSAQVINTYRYKPFGAQLAKTGVGADPSFLWVGTQGYRKTSRKFSDFYVRARHYSSAEGRWTTRDPIGEAGGINLYGFVGNNPVSYVDPLGLSWYKDLFNFVGDQELAVADAVKQARASRKVKQVRFT